MNEAASRFVSILAPDVVETGARLWASPSPSERPRRPRSTTPGMPALGKEEPMSTTNPTPEEVQASLHGPLAAFIEAQPDPLRKAELMIHLAQYQVELSKMAPILAANDDAGSRGILETWFAQGHPELKKALVNVTNGQEDYPLAKMAVVDGPDVALAKMLAALPTERRPAMLHTMAVYRSQLHEMNERGGLLKIDPATMDEALEQWTAAGDGSHLEMKKALANAEREARRIANASVGENELSDEKAGNAATHTASKLSGQHDKTYGARSSGEGAGARMRGSEPAPDQEDAGTPTPSSGPNDTGGGEMRPSAVVTRRGTTGGLGSVRGADGGEDAGGIDAMGDHDNNGVPIDMSGKKKKPKKMDKSAWLGADLVTLAPEPMIERLRELPRVEQLALCEKAADTAADLMAWSDQIADQLAKSECDSAVATWLREDPDTLVLKQWVAEALATAEEIPLDLAKTIMAYTPNPPRVRPRYRTAA